MRDFKQVHELKSNLLDQMKEGYYFMEKIATISIHPEKLPKEKIWGQLYTVKKKQEDKAYTNDKSVLVEIPFYVRFGDRLLNFFVKKILKNNSVSEYYNMLEFVYFSHLTAYYISIEEFDLLLFENENLKEKVLLQFENKNKYVMKTKVIGE